MIRMNACVVSVATVGGGHPAHLSPSNKVLQDINVSESTHNLKFFQAPNSAYRIRVLRQRLTDNRFQWTQLFPSDCWAYGMTA
jgi:hypothetical protein